MARVRLSISDSHPEIEEEPWSEEAGGLQDSLDHWISQLQSMLGEIEDLPEEAETEQDRSSLLQDAQESLQRLQEFRDEFPSKLRDIQEEWSRLQSRSLVRTADSRSALPGASEEWDEAELGEQWETELWKGREDE